MLYCDKTYIVETQDTDLHSRGRNLYNRALSQQDECINHHSPSLAEKIDKTACTSDHTEMARTESSTMQVQSFRERS